MHAGGRVKAESTSKCNTGQNYNKSLKNSSLGVEKFNFSLGLRLIFSCTEWNRAILLTDRRFAGEDTLATSNALAGALKMLDYDIIITGRQAIDGDTAQVGPEMSEHLGLPHISYVAGLEYGGDKTLRVKKETEEGYMLLETGMPVLLTVLASAFKPRYMSVHGIVESYSREVEVWTADKIDVDESKLGLKGSPTKVFKAFAKGLKQAGEVYEVTPEEAVDLIVSKLKEKYIL